MAENQRGKHHHATTSSASTMQGSVSGRLQRPGVVAPSAAPPQYVTSTAARIGSGAADRDGVVGRRNTTGGCLADTGDGARLVSGGDRHARDASDGLGLDAHCEAADRHQHHTGEPAREVAVDASGDDGDDHEEGELEDDERWALAAPETLPEQVAGGRADREPCDGDGAAPTGGRAVATDRHAEERHVAALICREHTEQSVEPDRVHETGNGGEHRRHHRVPPRPSASAAVPTGARLRSRGVSMAPSRGQIGEARYPVCLTRTWLSW